MLRLFIAIELSEKQKEEVTGLQNKLKQYLDGVRWVKPAGMHLTLKFLGDTEPAQVEQVKAAMDEAVSDLGSFGLAYGRSGVFPSPAKARVIWLGLKDGEEQVRKLAENMEQALYSRGFPRDKKAFTPHLTIGRARGRIPKNKIECFIEQEEAFETARVRVDGVVLFESRLNPEGAIHTPLYTASLES